MSGIPIQVIGAGPAGSAAAISAIQCGAQVELVERSHFPRHKVCGEFLSPEIVPALERLGVWCSIEARNPPRIRRMVLHFGERQRADCLSDGAFGLSRYALDEILFSKAVESGSTQRSEVDGTTRPTIWAAGRTHNARRGSRLFGF